MSAGAPDNRLLMGRIGAAHGIRGEVRIQSFAEDPLALAEYGTFATNRPGLIDPALVVGERIADWLTRP